MAVLGLNRSLLYGVLVGLLSCCGLPWPAAAQTAGAALPNMDKPAGPTPHLALQVGHREAVQSVAYSPDGKTIASESWDGTVKLWDARSGDIKFTLPGHLTGVAQSVDFSRDGRMVASGGALATGRGGTIGDVRLWDARDGKLLGEISLKLPVFSVHFMPDGATLAVATYQPDEYTDQGVTILREYTDKPSDYGPGGKYPSASIGFWDVSDETLASSPEREILITNFDPDPIIAFSANDSKAAVAFTSADMHFTSHIHVWDTGSGKLLRTISLPQGHICALAIAPDGKSFVSRNGDGKIVRWDIATAKQEQTFRIADASDINSITATVLKLAKAQGISPPLSGLRSAVEGDTGSVTCLLFSPDGKTLASAWGNFSPYVKLWDFRTGKTLRRMVWLKTEQVYSMAFSPDGSALACAGGHAFAETNLFGTVRKWNSATGGMLWEKEAKVHAFAPAEVSADGRTMVAPFVSSGGYQCWNLQTGTLQQTVRGIAAIGLSTTSDGKIAAIGGWLFKERKGIVELRDAATARPLRTLPAGSFAINGVAFSPDGKSVVGGSEVARMWDVATGKLQCTLQRPATGVTFSPDGRFLATMGPLDFTQHSNDGQLTLWDVEKRKPVWTLPGRQYIAGSLSFSPDGTTVAFVDFGRAVDLIGTATGKDRILQKAVDDPDGLFTSAVFADGGRTLTAVNMWGALYRWDTKSGALQRTGIRAEPLQSHQFDVASNGAVFVDSGENIVQFKNAATGTVLLTLDILYVGGSGQTLATDWIAYTPDGHYDCSAGAAKYIRWRIGDTLYPAEKCEQEFHQPGLIPKVLNAFHTTP